MPRLFSITAMLQPNGYDDTATSQATFHIPLRKKHLIKTVLLLLILRETSEWVRY